jgi:cyclic pyranopterin phosphate synthase
MVDVGAKQHTKRVAVATGIISFGNINTLKMILEDTNKKGDVLGTARIAGIMAAKRTSDIIPLCHPIALTKVEVTITPRGPGALSVDAHVDCTGPTGVEMEALTAVSGTLLTIYDMCKAVDRNMTIHSSRVAYKSGGRSGTHFAIEWLRDHGGQKWAKMWAPEWFVEEAEIESTMGHEEQEVSTSETEGMRRKKIERARRSAVETVLSRRLKENTGE